MSECKVMGNEPVRKLIYIASPYVGDVEQNTRYAIRCCKYAIEAGYAPIAPHLLYPQMLDDAVPEERALGLELGRQLLAGCEEVWVCGKRLSSGMAGEIAYAETLHIPVRYMTEL